MTVSDIQVEKKNKKRANIYSDGEYLCSLYIDTITENNIRIDTEISQERLSELLFEDEKKYAFQVAFDYISYKMRSVREVEKKLESKNVSEEIISQTVCKLQNLGYLDDREYAELYVQELSDRLGKIAIEQKLFLKGIDKKIIKEFTHEIKQGELARKWAEKLYNKYRNEDKIKAKQKIFRSMVTKGFAFDEINCVINDVFSDND